MFSGNGRKRDSVGGELSQKECKLVAFQRIALNLDTIKRL